MSTPRPSLRPPIGFAHRGARAHAPENTLAAFEMALEMGATGLESDVWITSDGVAVLDHDGVVGSMLRRRSMREVRRGDLPDHVPELADLYERCGTDFDLSLDVKDPVAFHEVVSVAEAAGSMALHRLWLCHHDWHVVAGWRSTSDVVRLVDSTHVKRMKEGPEKRAAQLRQAGIDAVNLHHSEWTPGLVALFHRFDRYAFGWDAQHARVLDDLLDMGIDAVYSDHVDRLSAAIGRLS